MTGNNASAAGYPIAMVGYHAEMAAFDRLPKTAKRMLTIAPLSFSSVHAERFWKQQGAAALRQEIRLSVRELLLIMNREYPGKIDWQNEQTWTPMPRRGRRFMSRTGARVPELMIREFGI